MQKKKKENSQKRFASPPLASVFMRGGVGGGSFGGLRSRDLSLQKHQKQEHKHTTLNSVETLSGTFPLPLLCSRSAEANVPRSMLTVALCISNECYPVGPRPKNTSKRRRTQLNNNEKIT